jgi:hypothetical protein
LIVHIRKFRSGYAPQIDHARNEPRIYNPRVVVNHALSLLYDPLWHPNGDHYVHLAEHFRKEVYIQVR